MPESTNLDMLAKGLKLVVPSSVKGCRKAGARRLSQKAQNDHETSSTEEGHNDKHKSEMKAKKTNLKNISSKPPSHTGGNGSTA